MTYIVSADKYSMEVENIPISDRTLRREGEISGEIPFNTMIVNCG